MVDQQPQTLPDTAPQWRCHDSLIALFCLGAVVFHPLVISIFDYGAGTSIFGVPLLFFYIFAGWSLLIVLLAIVVTYSRGLESPSEQEPPDSGSS